MENFNGHFKGIFEGHGTGAPQSLVATQRFALGTIRVYQIALWYRFEHALPLKGGLKAFFKAASCVICGSKRLIFRSQPACSG